jgi:hypothetical protein
MTKRSNQHSAFSNQLKATAAANNRFFDSGVWRAALSDQRLQRQQIKTLTGGSESG